jgi:alpha-glucosidase
VWEQPWGESRYVRNNYNELTIDVKETSGKQRAFQVVFRVFNDGLGFRYQFSKQENKDSVYIMDELTQFKLANDYQAWWIRLTAITVTNTFIKNQL